MAYTTINDVRALSKLTDVQVSDEDMTRIILNSTAEINGKINIPVNREKVSYIDDIRKNTIDGVNTVFYIRNFEKYISDLNDDGEVDASDVIVYKQLNSTETIEVVSSVTNHIGKITLTTAPEQGSQLFITYKYSSFDVSIPDTMISLGTTYLAIAMGYLKKDAGVPTTVKFSSISISRKLSDSYGVYYDRYKLILDEINTRSGVSGGYIATSLVRI